MTFLPVDRHTFRLFKVPRKDILKISKSLNSYEQGEAGDVLRLPARMAKRSVLAWSLLLTYRESPVLVVFGIFAAVFLIPFIFFVRLFS